MTRRRRVHTNSDANIESLLFCSGALLSSVIDLSVANTEGVPQRMLAAVGPLFDVLLTAGPHDTNPNPI